MYALLLDMAGYSGYSKSNNAVDAEERGLLVASRLAAWVRKAGGRRYRGLTARDIEARLRYAEWHHASCKFNIVNYYDPLSLASACNREALVIAAAHRRNEKPRLYPVIKSAETSAQMAARLGMTRAK